MIEGEQMMMNLDGMNQENAEETPSEMKKGSENFTEEEKKEIIARARVYGIRDVAEEIGIPWETIRGWHRNAPVEKEKKEEPEDVYSEEEKRKTLERAKEVGIYQAAKEAGITWQRLSRWRKKLTPENAGVREEKTEEIDPEEAAYRQAILARAEEIGIMDAAKEANMTWQQIAGWKRKMKLKTKESDHQEGKKTVRAKKEETIAPEEETRRRAVLERAKEIGIMEAAKEAGEKWQTVAWWKRKLAPDQDDATTENDDGAENRKKTEKAQESTFVPDDRQRQILARAAEIGVRQAAEEAGEKWQTIAWWKRKAEKAEKPAEVQVSDDTDVPKLREQNQQLREKIAELEEKIEKIRQAALKMAEME